MAYSIFKNTHSGVWDSKCNKVIVALSMAATNQGREDGGANTKAGTCGPSRTTSAGGSGGRRVIVEVNC